MKRFAPGKLLREESRRLLLWLAAGTVISAALGHAIAGIALILFAYVLWSLRNLQRLHDWLHGDTGVEVPESSAIWGHLFDRIHLLQRQEKQSRQALESIISRAQESVAALADAVLLIDEHGVLEWWNPAAAQLLQLRSDDKGRVLVNILREPRFLRYLDAGDFSEPLVMPAPGNEALQIQIQITRFGRNDRLLIMRDITRLKNLEQMRKDFVANVSHELRTPLTVINGYLETLIDSFADTPDSVLQRWRKPLHQMQSQAERMTAIVNDLLLLSRLENDELQPPHEPINMLAMMQTLRLEAEQLAQQKSASDQHPFTIELQIENNAGLQGSEKDLHSAFSNLVSNAVKYSPEGGRIQLRWWRDNETLCLSVQDSGMGIDPLHIPRLTERFYRADPSRTASTGGTGLGLAIVKHVLLQHGGMLDIHSAPGKGSLFICRFPLERGCT